MRALRASSATSSGLFDAERVLAVGEQHDDRRQLARALAVGRRDRRLRRLQPAREPVAHRGAAVGDHPLERALDRAAVGRRRDDLLGVVGERDEAEAEVVGRLLGQHLGRLDRRGQAVRVDVVGAHRAGDVVDEHDRGRALRGGDAALRPRDGEDQRGDREQQHERRQVAAPAGPRGHQAGQQRGVAERGRLAPAPPLHREVGEHRDRQQREAEQDGRLAEAHGAPPAVPAGDARGGGGAAPLRRRASGGAPRRARPAARPAPGARRRRRGPARRRPARCGACGRRAAGGPARSRSQSPPVESTTWSAPARRSAAATSSRSAAAAALKRLRTPRRLVFTTSWRPVSGSTIQRSPTGGSSSSRGSRTSTASTPWRARSARSAALPVARARGSPTRRRRARARARAPPSAAPPRRATSRRCPSSGSAIAQLGQQPEQPGAPLARRQHARLVAAERDDAEPVAAPRRDVADRERDALGDVGLAPQRRAERHRRRDVEHQPRRHRALADVHAHVRLAHPRGHVPVDVADVVARLVRPDHRQLGAGADLRRQVVARHERLDPPHHGEVERAQDRVGDRPRPGPLRACAPAAARRRRITAAAPAAAAR